MRPEPVFKRYDIRGSYPEEIDEEFAEILGKAVGTFASQEDVENVVVCRDNKQSSQSLKEKLIHGLKATGTEVIDAGVGPTDYAAFAGSSNEAISVQVTSSHLSLSTNGFKLMYPEGNGFVNKDLNRIEDLFKSRKFEENDGSIEDIEEKSIRRYKQKTKAFFNEYYTDPGRKVVLETMGGAGSVFLLELLEELGIEVIDLDVEKEGPYIDPPNPEPKKLEHVEQKVDETDADIGLATDMDADRVALYHDGEWMDGNDLFAMFVELLKPHRVVASIDTSQKVEKAVEKYGEISHTRVGDPFVVQEMIDRDAGLSGEPNGHYCFRGFVYYNSGTLAALLLAGSDIELLKQSIPEYYNVRGPVEVEDKAKAMGELREEIQKRYNVVSEVDGVKFMAEGAVVLVRSSGSSEKLRIIADANTEEIARNALEEVKDLVENLE